MFYLILFLLGAIVGSFVNVVIYRLPAGRTFIKGRSECPECKSKIPWHDLFPIVSFFVLRFHCRQCQAKISWTYPAVETYSGLIFLLSFWFLGGNLIVWLFSLALLEIFLILAVIDLRHFILPDAVIIFGLVIALIHGIINKYFLKSGLATIFSVENLLAGFLAFFIFFLVWFFSKGGWMGLGDAKLAGLVGLIFGLNGALIIIYGAVVLGGLTGLILLAAKKASLKTKLPFGSFLSVSGSFYLLFSPLILEKSKEILWRIIF